MDDRLNTHGLRLRRAVLLTLIALAAVGVGGPGGAAAAGSGSSTTSASGSAPPPGNAEIAYLALTFDGRTLTLYVNGKVAAFHTETGPADSGAPRVEIGAYSATQWWNGAVDEVALYRAALTPREIADHYRIGTTQGTAYPAAVKQSPDVVGYWPLDDPRRITDAVGSSSGAPSKVGVVRWYSLLGGSRDPAIAFNGLDGELQISRVPTVKSFTVEAWVLPGPRVSNRAIVSRPGAWFIKTDILGRWNGGFFHKRRVVSVTAASAAKPPPHTKPPSAPATSTGSGSGSKGSSTPIASVIVLMVIAGLVAASIPLRRRRRRREEASEEPAAKEVAYDGQAPDADPEPDADAEPDADPVPEVPTAQVDPHALTDEVDPHAPTDEVDPHAPPDEVDSHVPTDEVELPADDAEPDAHGSALANGEVPAVHASVPDDFDRGRATPARPGWLARVRRRPSR